MRECYANIKCSLKAGRPQGMQTGRVAGSPSLEPSLFILRPRGLLEPSPAVPHPSLLSCSLSLCMCACVCTCVHGSHVHV